MSGTLLPMRCVLVLPDEQTPPPPSLVAGLERRGLRVEQAAGPERAMVELGRRPAAAVVVVEPIRIRGGEHLLDAVHDYHPSVVCWRFEPNGSGSGRLASFAEGQHPPGPAPRPSGIERLVHRVDRPDDDTSPLITEEELAMLLGEMPDDADGLGWGKNRDSAAPGP